MVLNHCDGMADLCIKSYITAISEDVHSKNLSFFSVDLYVHVLMININLYLSMTNYKCKCTLRFIL